MESMIPFSEFEKTPRGDAPYRLSASHPDGKYLAMQAGPGPDGFVWEKETKQIVWKPDRARALAWLRNGTQIAAFREGSTSSYEFALYSWPKRQLLQSCPVSPALDGWAVDMIVSPQNNFALCMVVNEDDVSFEFVDITSQGVSQDVQAGYLLKGPNDVMRPAFSPDGQLWVCCSQRYESWWAPDPEAEDAYEQPARGGEYELGTLLVFRGKQQPPRTIPLIATLPAGWRPADPIAIEALFLSDPVFLDAHHVQVRLPSGETQVHQVSAD